jgi:hypothetical protein
MEEEPGIDVRDLLNAQTGRLAWLELQRHFARGVVIRVAGDLDLVEAAARVVEDDKAVVRRWLGEGRLAHATLADARRWERDQVAFWAVVAAPWVLVQEVGDRRAPLPGD